MEKTNSMLALSIIFKRLLNLFLFFQMKLRPRLYFAFLLQLVSRKAEGFVLGAGGSEGNVCVDLWEYVNSDGFLLAARGALALQSSFNGKVSAIFRVTESMRTRSQSTSCAPLQSEATRIFKAEDVNLDAGQNIEMLSESVSSGSRRVILGPFLQDPRTLQLSVKLSLRDALSWCGRAKSSSTVPKMRYSTLGGVKGPCHNPNAFEWFFTPACWANGGRAVLEPEVTPLYQDAPDGSAWYCRSEEDLFTWVDLETTHNIIADRRDHYWSARSNDAFTYYVFWSPGVEMCHYLKISIKEHCSVCMQFAYLSGSIPDMDLYCVPGGLEPIKSESFSIKWAVDSDMASPRYSLQYAVLEGSLKHENKTQRLVFDEPFFPSLIEGRFSGTFRDAANVDSVWTHVRIETFNQTSYLVSATANALPITACVELRGQACQDSSRSARPALTRQWPTVVLHPVDSCDVPCHIDDLCNLQKTPPLFVASHVDGLHLARGSSLSQWGCSELKASFRENKRPALLLNDDTGELFVIEGHALPVSELPSAVISAERAFSSLEEVPFYTKPARAIPSPSFSLRSERAPNPSLAFLISGDDTERPLHFVLVPRAPDPDDEFGAGLVSDLIADRGSLAGDNLRVLRARSESSKSIVPKNSGAIRIFLRQGDSEIPLRLFALPEFSFVGVLGRTGRRGEEMSDPRTLKAVPTRCQHTPNKLLDPLLLGRGNCATDDGTLLRTVDMATSLSVDRSHRTCYDVCQTLGYACRGFVDAVSADGVNPRCDIIQHNDQETVNVIVARPLTEDNTRCWARAASAGNGVDSDSCPPQSIPSVPVGMCCPKRLCETCVLSNCSNSVNFSGEHCCGEYLPSEGGRCREKETPCLLLPESRNRRLQNRRATHLPQEPALSTTETTQRDGDDLPEVSGRPGDYEDSLLDYFTLNARLSPPPQTAGIAAEPVSGCIAASPVQSQQNLWRVGSSIHGPTAEYIRLDDLRDTQGRALSVLYVFDSDPSYIGAFDHEVSGLGEGQIIMTAWGVDEEEVGSIGGCQFAPVGQRDHPSASPLLNPFATMVQRIEGREWALPNRIPVPSILYAYPYGTHSEGLMLVMANIFSHGAGSQHIVLLFYPPDEHGQGFGEPQVMPLLVAGPESSILSSYFRAMFTEDGSDSSSEEQDRDAINLLAGLHVNFDVSQAMPSTDGGLFVVVTTAYHSPPEQIQTVVYPRLVVLYARPGAHAEYWSIRSEVSLDMLQLGMEDPNEGETIVRPHLLQIWPDGRRILLFSGLHCEGTDCQIRFQRTQTVLLSIFYFDDTSGMIAHQRTIWMRDIVVNPRTGSLFSPSEGERELLANTVNVDMQRDVRTFVTPSGFRGIVLPANQQGGSVSRGIRGDTSLLIIQETPASDSIPSSDSMFCVMLQPPPGLTRRVSYSFVILDAPETISDSEAIGIMWVARGERERANLVVGLGRIEGQISSNDNLYQWLAYLYPADRVVRFERPDPPIDVESNEILPFVDSNGAQLDPQPTFLITLEDLMTDSLARIENWLLLMRPLQRHDDGSIVIALFQALETTGRAAGFFMLQALILSPRRNQYSSWGMAWPSPAGGGGPPPPAAGGFGGCGTHSHGRRLQQECAKDFFGRDCDYPCPNCSSKGWCDSGRYGSGLCICAAGWSGSLCNECARGFWPVTRLSSGPREWASRSFSQSLGNVLTESECLTAAHFLGLNASAHFLRRDPTGATPSGCYIDVSTGFATFNRVLDTKLNALFRKTSHFVQIFRLNLPSLAGDVDEWNCEIAADCNGRGRGADPKQPDFFNLPCVCSPEVSGSSCDNGLSMPSLNADSAAEHPSTMPFKWHLFGGAQVALDNASFAFPRSGSGAQQYLRPANLVGRGEPIPQNISLGAWVRLSDVIIDGSDLPPERQAWISLIMRLRGQRGTENARVKRKLVAREEWHWFQANVMMPNISPDELVQFIVEAGSVSNATEAGTRFTSFEIGEAAVRAMDGINYSSPAVEPTLPPIPTPVPTPVPAPSLAEAPLQLRIRGQEIIVEVLQSVVPRRLRLRGKFVNDWDRIVGMGPARRCFSDGEGARSSDCGRINGSGKFNVNNWCSKLRKVCRAGETFADRRFTSFGTLPMIFFDKPSDGEAATQLEYSATSFQGTLYDAYLQQPRPRGNYSLGPILSESSVKKGIRAELETHECAQAEYYSEHIFRFDDIPVIFSDDLPHLDIQSPSIGQVIEWRVRACIEQVDVHSQSDGDEPKYLNYRVSGSFSLQGGELRIALRADPQVKSNYSDDSMECSCTLASCQFAGSGSEELSDVFYVFDGVHELSEFMSASILDPIRLFQPGDAAARVVDDGAGHSGGELRRTLFGEHKRMEAVFYLELYPLVSMSDIFDASSNSSFEIGMQLVNPFCFEAIPHGCPPRSEGVLICESVRNSPPRNHSISFPSSTSFWGQARSSNNSALTYHVRSFRDQGPKYVGCLLLQATSENGMVIFFTCFACAPALFSAELNNVFSPIPLFCGRSGRHSASLRKVSIFDQSEASVELDIDHVSNTLILSSLSVPLPQRFVFRGSMQEENVPLGSARFANFAVETYIDKKQSVASVISADIMMQDARVNTQHEEVIGPLEAAAEDGSGGLPCKLLNMPRPSELLDEILNESNVYITRALDLTSDCEWLAVGPVSTVRDGAGLHFVKKPAVSPPHRLVQGAAVFFATKHEMPPELRASGTVTLSAPIRSVSSGRNVSLAQIPSAMQITAFADTSTVGEPRIWIFIHGDGLYFPPISIVGSGMPETREEFSARAARQTEEDESDNPGGRRMLEATALICGNKSSPPLEQKELLALNFSGGAGAGSGSTLSWTKVCASGVSNLCSCPRERVSDLPQRGHYMIDVLPAVIGGCSLRIENLSANVMLESAIFGDVDLLRCAVLVHRAKKKEVDLLLPLVCEDFPNISDSLKLCSACYSGSPPGPHDGFVRAGINCGHGTTWNRARRSECPASKKDSNENASFCAMCPLGFFASVSTSGATCVPCESKGSRPLPDACGDRESRALSAADLRRRLGSEDACPARSGYIEEEAAENHAKGWLPWAGTWAEVPEGRALDLSRADSRATYQVIEPALPLGTGNVAEITLASTEPRVVSQHMGDIGLNMVQVQHVGDLIRQYIGTDNGLDIAPQVLLFRSRSPFLAVPRRPDGFIEIRFRGDDFSMSARARTRNPFVNFIINDEAGQQRWWLGRIASAVAGIPGGGAHNTLGAAIMLFPDISSQPSVSFRRSSWTMTDEGESRFTGRETARASFFPAAVIAVNPPVNEHDSPTLSEPQVLRISGSITRDVNPSDLEEPSSGLEDMTLILFACLSRAREHFSFSGWSSQRRQWFQHMASFYGSLAPQGSPYLHAGSENQLVADVLLVPQPLPSTEGSLRPSSVILSFVVSTGSQMVRPQNAGATIACILDGFSIMPSFDQRIPIHASSLPGYDVIEELIFSDGTIFREYAVERTFYDVDGVLDVVNRFLTPHVHSIQPVTLSDGSTGSALLIGYTWDLSRIARIFSGTSVSTIQNVFLDEHAPFRWALRHLRELRGDQEIHCVILLRRWSEVDARNNEIEPSSNIQRLIQRHADFYERGERLDRSFVELGYDRIVGYQVPPPGQISNLVPGQSMITHEIFWMPSVATSSSVTPIRPVVRTVLPVPGLRGSTAGLLVPAAPSTMQPSANPFEGVPEISAGASRPPHALLPGEELIYIPFLEGFERPPEGIRRVGRNWEHGAGFALIPWSDDGDTALVFWSPQELSPHRATLLMGQEAWVFSPSWSWATAPSQVAIAPAHHIPLPIRGNAIGAYFNRGAPGDSNHIRGDELTSFLRATGMGFSASSRILEYDERVPSGPPTAVQAWHVYRMTSELSTLVATSPQAIVIASRANNSSDTVDETSEDHGLSESEIQELEDNPPALPIVTLPAQQRSIADFTAQFTGTFLTRYSSEPKSG